MCDSLKIESAPSTKWIHLWGSCWGVQTDQLWLTSATTYYRDLDIIMQLVGIYYWKSIFYMVCVSESSSLFFLYGKTHRRNKRKLSLQRSLSFEKTLPKVRKVGAFSTHTWLYHHRRGGKNKNFHYNNIYSLSNSTQR